MLKIAIYLNKLTSWHLKTKTCCKNDILTISSKSKLT